MGDSFWALALETYGAPGLTIGVLVWIIIRRPGQQSQPSPSGFSAEQQLYLQREVVDPLKELIKGS